MTYHIQDTIGFKLFITQNKLKAELTKAMRPYDTTPEQFAILTLLKEHNGLQQREIADILGKDRPNITRILDRLERKEMVVRKTDEEDRRATRVHITKAGRKICPKLEQIALDYRIHAYRGLSENDQAQLKNMLNQIAENLS